MTDAIETYQINKLPADLAEMAFDFSEAVEAAGQMPPTFVPLKILASLKTILGAGADLEEIIDAAKDALPNDTDAMRPDAVLNGALALNEKQSKRIYDLIGLVLCYMQQHTPKAAVNRTSPSPEARAEEKDASESHFVPSTFNLKFAFRMMSEEQDRCAALAHSLVVQLQSNDPENPTDHDDLTAWRLAEVLHDKLSSSEVSESVRKLLLGEEPSAASMA